MGVLGVKVAFFSYDISSSILWQESPLRENENIHEKPQLHEIWCGQSYLYMPYGTYGLGEIRASLIPLAEQFSFLTSSES